MNNTKIGIMTFYAVQNNGAALQAFALQQSIKKLGAEPELIRYFDRHNESVTVKETRWAKLVRNPKIIVGILFHPVRYRKLRGKSQENAQAYNKFRQEYLSASVEPYYEYEDLYEANKLYQGFIAGSDMVWTPIGQNLAAYFLQFADKEKRFSYSPSLTGCASFSKENIHIINEYLQGMTMISCREQEGVDFIKKNVGLDAVLTLDPTLLFNKEEWRKELSIECTKPNKPYILCYVFGGLPKHIAKEVNRIAEKYKMEVRLIPLLTKEYEFELDNGHNGPYGPREFVELFLNASFIVTNTYHGLMFSLISENPFVVLHREAGNVWKSNESRMSMVMSMLGVNERYIDTYQNIEDGFLSLDYKPILPILEEKKAKSLSYLNSVVISASENELGRSDRIDNVRLLSSKKCTGCGLCSLVCPIGAIEMKEDEEGFLGPVVNDSLCKECHLCAKRCPSIHPLQKNSIIDSYACISKNKLKEKSASGGFFITVAQYYIEVLKGVVYGVVFDNEMVCFHTEATTLKQSIPMQNSKYVQSNMNDICHKVKERLEVGTRVLFSGTPCQVASLKSYLHKEYDNLLTVEIVCHGVPSQKFWKYYLQHITTGRVKSFYFRNSNNKRINKTTFEATAEFQDKTKSTVRKILPYEDPYYGPFLKSESFRNSCYYCQYARKNRIADITIGDVDNSKTNREFYPLESKTMLLVNTEKGKELWYNVKGLFDFIPLDYEVESKVNLQLCMPSKYPATRKYLYRDLEMMKWSDFVKKYTTKISPIKQVILFCLKKFF